MGVAANDVARVLKTAANAPRANAGTTAVSFAKGRNNNNDIAAAGAKAGAVAGGIALRALIKGGKLAAHNDNNDDIAAKHVGITAAGKLMGALEDLKQAKY